MEHQHGRAHPEAYVVDNSDGVTVTLTLTNQGGASALMPKATTASRYDYTVTANTSDAPLLQSGMRFVQAVARSGESSHVGVG